MQDQSHYRKIESDNNFIIHIKKSCLISGAEKIKIDEVNMLGVLFLQKLVLHPWTPTATVSS